MIPETRSKIRETVHWDEPASFSNIKRAGYADVSWRVRIIGGCAVFALAYVNWLWRHTDDSFELTLGESMVLAAIIAAYFFLAPWFVHGSRCSCWVDRSGIHWSRGFRCGSIQFRHARAFTWRTESDIFVLSVARKDGSQPFEIGVTDAATRDSVSAILIDKGIREAGEA